MPLFNSTPNSARLASNCLRKKGSAWFLLLVLVAFKGVSAQTGPTIPVDDPVFWTFQALSARGVFPSRLLLDFPVKESTFEAAVLEAENRHPSLIRPLTTRIFSQNALSRNGYGLRIRPGVTLASQESQDFLRPEREPVSVVYSLLNFESWFTAGNFTAAWGWRHDRYYDRDPEGLDTAHRWAIRPENAYLSYDGKYAQVMVGRTRRQWGLPERAGLILSDNARPMDHISFKLGTDQLFLHTVLSELDSITGDGRFTGTAGDDSVSSGSERRYLAVHKLTFQASASWTFGVTHSILYSGTNSSLSLKFLNPFHLAILSVDEKPKNDENNGLIGAFFMARKPDLLVTGQLLIDDFDILNGREPASIAANVTSYFANVVPRADLSLSATLVTGRTYNAEQAEGKYLYLKRGIGTQNADYLHVSVAMPIFMQHGLIVTPGVDVLFQGEADIRMPFPGHEESPAIFDGVIERTLRPSLQVQALLPNNLDVRAGLGINVRSNAFHEKEVRKSELSGYFSVGYRFMWDGTLK